MAVPPDVFFTTFPFPATAIGAGPTPPTGTGPQPRTLPNRFADFINVKDYGVTGDGSTHDDAAIQAILTATSGGGTIYFPPGNYVLSNPLALPADTARRRFIGAGRTKSVFFGTLADYMIKTDYGGRDFQPIELIAGLGFNNNYVQAKTNFLSPDPISFATGLPLGGCGCIYLPCGGFMLLIDNCDFILTSGVGIYAPGIGNTVRNCHVNGNYSGISTQPITIGIWGPASISDGKVEGCRYAIVCGDGQNLGVIHTMGIERCQIGIRGSNPYPYWNRNNNSITAAETGSSTNLSVTGISFESPGSSTGEGGAMIDARKIAGSTFTNIFGGSFLQDSLLPEYGLRFEGSSCHFENCDFSGAYSVAAIASTATNTSTKWKSITAAVGSGGGVPWLLSPGGTQGSPDIFIQTYPIDGGQPFANLVPCQFGAMAICSDSSLPAWTTGGTPVSNVGKPIVAAGGGAAYRVAARYATVTQTILAAASWVGPSPGPGTPNITMVLANPGNVVAGMGVIDVTTGIYLGQVSTYVGTALTLQANAAAASSGSADSLVFATWCIAG